MENKFVLWVALVLGGIPLLAQENPREILRKAIFHEPLWTIPMRIFSMGGGVSNDFHYAKA